MYAPNHGLCPGGIRSGFLYLVLRECFPDDGVAVQVEPKNYDGSMWQWADDAKAPMALGDTPSGSTVAEQQGR